jgi:hypothetical protein
LDRSEAVTQNDQASAGEREAEEFQEEVEAALAQHHYTSFLARRV